jgi:hypothetical protein
MLQGAVSGGPPPEGVLNGFLALAKFPLIIFRALTAMALLAGPSLIVTAAFLAALGYGMWRPKNWARIITIALAAWMLAVRLFNRPTAGVSSRAMWLLWVGLCIGVVGYLFTPAVRSAFRPTAWSGRHAP